MKRALERLSSINAEVISVLHAEVWPDAMMVRYCLCCVVRPVALELAQQPDTPFKPSLRRSLFDALSLGSEEGSLGISSLHFQLLPYSVTFWATIDGILNFSAPARWNQLPLAGSDGVICGECEHHESKTVSDTFFMICCRL